MYAFINSFFLNYLRCWWCFRQLYSSFDIFLQLCIFFLVVDFSLIGLLIVMPSKWILNVFIVKFTPIELPHAFSWCAAVPFALSNFLFWYGQVLCLRKPDEPIDLFMVEIMHMRHKFDVDTRLVCFMIFHFNLKFLSS